MTLLDTPIWWWAMNRPRMLSAGARTAIDQAAPDELRVAAISLWEVALLIHQKRIVLEVPPDDWFRRAIGESGIQVEPLTPTIALEAYRLPEPFHRDPADRLIVATARVLGARLITKDRLIRDYPHVATVWD